MKRNTYFGGIVTLSVIVVAACCFCFSPKALAADDFSLQVTPSPLVATVKPGQATELELKIRNASTAAEELKIEPRSFVFKSGSQQVALKDTTPPGISNWISFGAPNFTVPPGGWFTQKVRLALPEEAGFSYSFALLISRKSDPKPTAGGRLIKGSVAVFTLVNVDRPGAIRKLDAGKFTASKRMYEYLPATFDIRLKNTGNTIVQPYGNIFIQRGEDSGSPIRVLAVNETKGYILPDTTRTLTSHWTEGFPAYQTTKAPDGTEKTKLVWDWNKVSKLRIGRYTAKLVAVYNDGQRDVPIEGHVSFWVIPWKILAGLLVILIILGIGIWSLVRKLGRLFARTKAKAHSFKRRS